LQLHKNKFVLADSSIIFKRTQFFELYSGPDDLYLEATLNTENGVSCYFNKEKTNSWRSPSRGTFAGPTIVGNVSPHDYDTALRIFETELVKQGAKSIHYSLQPSYISQDYSDLTETLLWHQGYRLSQSNMNHHISVNDRPFIESISPSKRRLLKKNLKQGHRVKKLASNYLEEVYDLIAQNREKRGLKPSMSKFELKNFYQAFKDQVHMFGVEASNGLIAAAFCIQIMPSTIYVFYWGHRPDSTKPSPMILLHKGIYQYCLEQNIRCIDLGTSTTIDQIDWGLTFFKNTLNSIISKKVNMSKKV